MFELPRPRVQVRGVATNAHSKHNVCFANPLRAKKLPRILPPRKMKAFAAARKVELPGIARQYEAVNAQHAEQLLVRKGAANKNTNDTSIHSIHSYRSVVGTQRSGLQVTRNCSTQMGPEAFFCKLSGQGMNVRLGLFSTNAALCSQRIRNRDMNNDKRTIL